MLYKALNLEPDEDVIIEVRKHWIVFAGYALVLLVVAVFPLVIFVLLKMFTPQILHASMPINILALFLFLYSLWLLFLWISFFVHWTTYYLDVWYVTEKRIIIIDQKSLFHREVSNLTFDKIQDVTLDVNGFISTMLKFSDVRVQTASEDNKEFIMTTVRHPEEVREIIFSHQNKNHYTKMVNQS